MRKNVGRSSQRGVSKKTRNSWPRIRLRNGWVASEYPFPQCPSCGNITHFSGQMNKVAVRYYMDYYDFTGLRLDNAFR